ncbi:MAG TPA: hypothetical protein VLI05_05715 [Candidatus Saccharimonadia bacterium]|nr:hypothetical protein [Candidatus Saccharimonadia bacterium]
MHACSSSCRPYCRIQEEDDALTTATLKERVEERRTAMRLFALHVPPHYQFMSCLGNSWSYASFTSIDKLPLVKRNRELPPTLRSPADLKGCGLTKPVRRLFEQLLRRSTIVDSITVTDAYTFKAEGPWGPLAASQPPAPMSIQELVRREIGKLLGFEKGWEIVLLPTRDSLYPE